MNLVKKNETLANIKTSLQGLKKSVKDPDSNKAIQQLIRKIKSEETQDEHWEQMMMHFNQLHSGYFDKLKDTYPELTPKDLKMCAYLKMNLTTKEMTSLLNVTTRGVEASRYRLRKKFKLQKDQNLTEFLMQFGK
jgi:FixJ family two-component response regulator